MSVLLRPAQVLVDSAMVEGIGVLVDGNRVIAVGSGLVGDETIELPELALAPGLIDVHVHVLDGFGVIGPDGPDLGGLGRALLARGVTAYLATSVTSPHRELLTLMGAAGAAAAGAAGARCLGVHLEGPWISTAHLGAQPAESVTSPSLEQLAELLAAGPLRLLTIAPEIDGATEVIAGAKQAGVVVSMGHSDATYDQAVTAVNAGVSHVTHCFNAMRGLHHREPGAVGAALDLPGLTVEAIADGVHLHPAMLRLIWRTRGAASMCLVSDAVHFPSLEAADATRLADGTLAGAVNALDHGLRTCVAAGIPLADALVMASRTPADLLGRTDLGRIQPGALADLIALDADLNVIMVMRDGRASWL